jgi:hypothetical protein
MTVASPPTDVELPRWALAVLTNAQQLRATARQLHQLCRRDDSRRAIDEAAQMALEAVERIEGWRRAGDDGALISNQESLVRAIRNATDRLAEAAQLEQQPAGA